MTNFVFYNLLPNNFEIKGDISILPEFNSEIKIQSVLFYPSSGEDLVDLFYVNSKRIKEISECSPNVFIHTDYYSSTNFLQWPWRISQEFDNFLNFPNYNRISTLIYHNDKKAIHLYKLKRPNSNEIKWLIFFSGYFNEDILKDLISNKIKIPVVFSVCDGITSGMGGCNEEAVPTLLYPLLAVDLGIKFIITEQNRRRLDLSENLLWNSKQLKQWRRWMENILLIKSNSFVEDLLILSDEDLMKGLRQKLGAIHEQEFNTDGCVIPRGARDLKIKKMSV